MSEPNDSEGKPRPSLTAIPSEDTMGLGRTPGQRAAEMIAGIRAEIMPSPLTTALTSLIGRAVAGTLMRLESDRERAANFIIGRYIGLSRLAEESLPEGGQSGTIVEVAAGFSPRGMEFASERPGIQYIEVDLPDVVEEKQKRLEKAEITPPPNLSWLAADLGVTPLAEVLGERKVDVVLAEGLMAYFPHSEVIRIAAHIREVLVPGGSLLCTVPWREGMQHLRMAVRFFRRLAGQHRGIVEDENQARELFESAGYTDVSVYQVSQLAESMGIPTPLTDFAFLVRAKTS